MDEKVRRLGKIAPVVLVALILGAGEPVPAQNRGFFGRVQPSQSDIIIRASGTSGREHINLIIAGRVVADFDLSRSVRDYVYRGRAAGDIQVEFDNDADGRDVILDFVFVNNEIREAEDQSFNTTTFRNRCGDGSFSEMMNCNGAIGFGNTDDCFSRDCRARRIQPSQSDIIIRASGTSGREHINLIIAGRVVADFNLNRTVQDYVYRGRAAGDIQVEFDNDADGRDVILDFVFVNSEIREAEDQSFNTTTFRNRCGDGSFSEMMNCNGAIGFGNTDDCFSGTCFGF